MKEIILKVTFALSLMLMANSQINAQTQSYTRFQLNLIDSFKIQKFTQKDRISRIKIQNNKLIYYSYDSCYVMLYDLKNKSLTKYTLMENRKSAVFKPFNFVYEYLNDSTIAFVIENRWPYVDKKVGLLNLNSGVVSHPYDMDIPMLLVEKEFEYKDGLADALGSVNYWFSPSPYYFPIIQDSTIFVPILNGMLSDSLKSNLRTNKNNLLRFGTKGSSIESKEISSFYTALDSTFKDSLNSEYDLSYLYMPNILKLNDSIFIISYKGVSNIVLYNLKRDLFQYKNVNTSFFDNQSPVFNHQTNHVKNIYWYSDFLIHPNNPYIIRVVAFPLPEENKNSVELNRHTCMLLYDKQFNCIAISDDYNKTIPLSNPDKDCFYGYNRIESEKSDSWIYVKKFIVSPLETVNESYKIYQNDVLNIQRKKIKEYIEKISIDLLNKDTIPVLIIDDVCPSCINKVGHYLNKLYQLNTQYKPFIIVSKSKMNFDLFKKKYNIEFRNDLLLDSTNLLSNYINYSNIGFLIKENNEFRFVQVNSDYIKEVLSYINPKNQIIGDTCIPIE